MASLTHIMHNFTNEVADRNNKVFFNKDLSQERCFIFLSLLEEKEDELDNVPQKTRNVISKICKYISKNLNFEVGLRGRANKYIISE